MALLNIMTRGSYTNDNAVSNVLKYVLRIRKNEDRRQELLFWGGLGVPMYSAQENVIYSFLYVQNAFGINWRKGKRIFHEVVSISCRDFSIINNNYETLRSVILEYCNKEYFQQGFQVVYAVHWDPEKILHVHFVVNAINYIDGKKWHTNYSERQNRENSFNEILRRFQQPISCECLSEDDMEKILCE